jgi:hypothetical protein
VRRSRSPTARLPHPSHNVIKIPVHRHQFACAGLTWQGGELVNNLRAYATRLIGCSVEAEFETLRLQAQGALTRLRAAHHRAADKLEHLKSAYLDARREFDSFRQRHRLQRSARNLTHRWTTFGLLLVIVAFEAGSDLRFSPNDSQQSTEFGILSITLPEVDETRHHLQISSFVMTGAVNSIQGRS